jgi:hypothetical protein
MNEINIESAQYAVDMDNNNSIIAAVIDGVTMSVPLDPANRHYAAIMEMVDAGELTIAEADA